MERERLGVRIIGFVMLICMIPALVTALIAFVSGFRILGVNLQTPVIVSPLIFLVFSIGLLFFRNWARLLVIYFSPFLALVLWIGLNLVIGLILKTPSVYFKFVIFSAGFLSAIFLIAIVYYLTRPKVKEQFR